MNRDETQSVVLMNPIETARRLNAIPLAASLDRARVDDVLRHRPLIFSDTRIFVAGPHLRLMSAFVAAMERVAALPGWQARVLEAAPAIARHPSPSRGVFFGYDFHVGEDGPKLIEINTNAGGGPLNALLLQAQLGDRDGMADGAAVEQRFFAMFEAEWRAGGGSGKPGCIAIVDDVPGEQYLDTDFRLCRELFERHGIPALICDASELALRDGRIYHGNRRIDMVYNRLTDFHLDHLQHAVLRAAWLTDAALITPHPRAYALYADKRHMALLCDDAWLAEIGVDAATRALITQVVPSTERITAANAEDIRVRRKKLFFKPASGYGSKATYRGLNVTTRVFGEILAGDYVAQTIVPPGIRTITLDGKTMELKFDLRCYAYAGAVQMVAARLWQGQTTNFRTPGGGFTPVVEVGESA